MPISSTEKKSAGSLTRLTASQKRSSTTNPSPIVPETFGRRANETSGWRAAAVVTVRADSTASAGILLHLPTQEFGPVVACAPAAGACTVDAVDHDDAVAPASAPRSEER